MRGGVGAATSFRSSKGHTTSKVLAVTLLLFLSAFFPLFHPLLTSLPHPPHPTEIRRFTLSRFHERTPTSSHALAASLLQARSLLLSSWIQHVHFDSVCSPHPAQRLYHSLPSELH